MKTATGKIEYMSRDRKSIVITATVELRATPEILYADGDNISTGRTLISQSTKYSATYNGEYMGDNYVTCGAPRADGIVAGIGKIGLLAEKNKALKNLIAGLIAEAKKDYPEYLKGEKEEAEKEARAEENCREAAKDYKRKIASGMCPKCGTWCYGECNA